jgi:predicted TIM-barrel fold metal-dependent hydrolase
MATAIDRIVDAHVHFWDPARTDWYPYLAGQQELDMGDVSGMSRYFDAEVYFKESSQWPVRKLVHVAAAASFLLAETMEREEQAEESGHPAAIVGGIVPGAPTQETEELLDEQMAATRFRGIRPMGGESGAVPGAEVLQALQERDLVFDFMGHPDNLQAAAAALADWGGLTVVIEHTGWPRSNSDDEYELWKKGMSALAALGSNVNCKLSGLAMPLRSIGADTFKPWVHFCLEVFGVDRCMFASNFPVDGMHGTFNDLYSAYDQLTVDLDSEARNMLFASNAERVYRC